MKRILMTAIIMSAALLTLFAKSAKDIIDRMESVMDFDTLTFTALIENTDRLGTVTQVFETVRNGNGDTLMTVTSGMDRGQKILRSGNEIYVYYPDADEVIRLSDSGLSGSFMGSDFSYEDLKGDDDYSKRY